MAILRSSAPAGSVGRIRVASLGIVALLCLAGCILVDHLVQQDRPFAFSHRTHVEEQGLECADCHANWDESEDPGMPRAAQCALCHSDLDAEKPPELQVKTLFAEDGYRLTRAGHQSDEILFSHQSHATRGLDCSVCHAEVIADDGALADRGVELRMSMDECLACHEASTGPGESECAACHAVIRAGVSPPSHDASWRRFHGTVVRGRSDQRSDVCALCHAPSECLMCHQIEPPANHNNFWRRRGHGLTASMDRDSCFTCHDSDSCQRCHEEIRPQSHVGNWGAPMDRHCLACHEPVRSQTCGVCHPSTPSHDQATPLPPDHSPSMDCRLCHGNGQPQPHVENVQTCTSCHR